MLAEALQSRWSQRLAQRPIAFAGSHTLGIGRTRWLDRLRATMPAQVAVPVARAYEYYNPDRVGRSREARLTVE